MLVDWSQVPPDESELAAVGEFSLHNSLLSSAWSLYCSQGGSPNRGDLLYRWVAKTHHNYSALPRTLVLPEEAMTSLSFCCHQEGALSRFYCSVAVKRHHSHILMKESIYWGWLTGSEVKFIIMVGSIAACR